MSLVGSIIIGARDLFPDPCQTLSSPTITASTVTGSNTLFAGGATVSIKGAQGTTFGETAGSTEITATNASAFSVSVVVPVSYLATYVRVYFSVAGSGAEDQYVEQTIAVPANSVTVVLNSLATISQGIPPTITRAWLPDSDGNILSASRLYEWINEGLNIIGQFTGGIRDITGILSTQGQAQYLLVNQWQALDANFYDGYPIASGAKQQVFRHSNVTGLAGMATVNIAADRQAIEIWPQAQRTSGQATLNTAALSTDTTLQITPGVSGFVLGFGLILVGTYPPTALTGPGSCELIYYSQISSSTISQLTRGCGGTQPQAWPIGTAVYECNLYFTGKRQPQLYRRGQSAFTFTAPPAFEDAIRAYLLHRFKDAEQNTQESETKFKLFAEICDRIRNMQQPMKPRQVQIGGAGGVEVAVGLGSPFGGVIIR